MYDAIVLAGGHARRLDGIDKPGLDVGGSSLLEHVLAAVGTARRVVVVGPTRPSQTAVQWCQEQPPGGGPVAGLAAALAVLARPAGGPEGADPDPHPVVVLAADLPAIAPAVPALLAALAAADGVGAALLADPDGRVNHLAAAWDHRALVGALGTIGDSRNAAVRRLTAAVRTVLVDDPDGWGRDCDTWADVADARTRAEQRQR